MKKNWIDFKALRARLDFEQVLQHYNVEVKRKGTRVLACGHCYRLTENKSRWLCFAGQ